MSPFYCPVTPGRQRFGDIDQRTPDEPSLSECFAGRPALRQRRPLRSQCAASRILEERIQCGELHIQCRRSRWPDLFSLFRRPGFGRHGLCRVGQQAHRARQLQLGSQFRLQPDQRARRRSADRPAPRAALDQRSAWRHAAVARNPVIAGADGHEPGGPGRTIPAAIPGAAAGDGPADRHGDRHKQTHPVALDPHGRSGEAASDQELHGGRQPQSAACACLAVSRPGHDTGPGHRRRYDLWRRGFHRARNTGAADRSAVGRSLPACARLHRSGDPKKRLRHS